MNYILSDGEREREGREGGRKRERSCVCNKYAISSIVQPGAKPQCGLLKPRMAPENGVCPWR